METISQPAAALGALEVMRDTSAMALDAMGLKGRKSLQDRIMDICLREQRGGAKDLSGKEIQAIFERQHGQRIEASTVSGRVNDLVAAKRLERIVFTRKCTVTGRDIHAVRVPAAQARFTGQSF